MVPVQPSVVGLALNVLVVGLVSPISEIDARPEQRPVAISYFPLAGSADDEIAGGQLVFSRASVAFNRDGTSVPAGVMRTAQFAVETGRSYEFITPDLAGLQPFAADGSLLYGAEGDGIYTSTDGVNWTLDGTLDQSWVTSISITHSGAVLACAGDFGQARMYRRDPAGGPYVPVLDLGMGKALHWNHADTGTHLFVSEYGPKQPPNARRIYRSADDGLTWELVYDPEYRDSHNHKLTWDPYGGRVIQATGDADQLVIVSDDNGDTWQVACIDFPTLPSLDGGGPTASLARPEGVYFGLDGGMARGVKRWTLASDSWEHVLTVGRDYPQRDDQFTANVYAMTDYDGLIYAGFTLVDIYPIEHAPALYTSADGDHWALAHRTEYRKGGVYAFLGQCGGRLWCEYKTETSYADPLLVAISPDGVHQLITGTRFEGPAENLWTTLDTSSAEGDLTGWSAHNVATLAIDDTRAWHGQQSVRVSCAQPERAGVNLPTCPVELPAGTTISAAAHVYGKRVTSGSRSTPRVAN